MTSAAHSQLDLLGASSVMNPAVLELLLAVIADGRRLNGACI